MNIAVDPKRSIILLAFVFACLAAAHVIGQAVLSYFGHDYVGREVMVLVELFDFGSEGNLPTLYSSVLLLLCSILLAVIGEARRGSGAVFGRHWRWLALIFLYLCVDESVSLHEHLNRPLRAILDLPGFFHYAWVIPYSITLGLLLLWYRGFIAHLPEGTRLLFLIAGITYVSGALGMEVLKAHLAVLHGKETASYATVSTIAESLEMLGLLLFVYALMSYVKSDLKDLRLSIGDAYPDGSE